MVNLATIKVIFGDMRQRGPVGILRNLIMPIIGFGFIAWLWTSLAWFTFMVGGVWLTIGAVVYLVRRRKHGGPLVWAFDESVA